MYQNALVNYPIDAQSVTKAYIKALNKIANNILVKHSYGISRPINRLLALKIKNLLPSLQNNYHFKAGINQYNTILNA